MRKRSVSGSALAAFLAAGGAAGPASAAATDEAPQIAEAQALGAADLMYRYIQEDGPESGHVRVVLTPETRPITVIEARMAAQQAFLEALKEPGLGDNLQRVTVVVQLVPLSHPDPSGAQQVIVYQHRSGRDWSVLSGQ